MRRKTLLLACLLAGTPVYACGELSVTSPWVKLAPPNATVMAGYATFGASTQSVQLQGGSSADFERVELHSMSMDNGVMQMRKLDGIEVKPEQTVELAPGGMHLMLIGPKRPFAAGDSIELTLTYCDSQKQTVSFVVRTEAP